MPEVIIIDEIGTELDANAARTIAERGVQLVATAHGNTLDNLIINPTLADLIGGVQSVTLGDLEARRRRTQKTVLERKAPPTFDILVEIQSWNRVVVHSKVSDTVDRILRGLHVSTETRNLEESGTVTKSHSVTKLTKANDSDQQRSRLPFDQRGRVTNGTNERDSVEITSIMPYGVNKGKLQQIVKITRAPIVLVDNINKADLLLTTKNYYRRKTHALELAEQKGKPVYVLRRNTAPQIEQFLQAIGRRNGSYKNNPLVDIPVREAEEAVQRLQNGEGQVELNPQGPYIRHLQHEIATKYGLVSTSIGKEPSRQVIFYQH